MSERERFIDTNHCRSLQHCHRCRDRIDGRRWRQSLAKAFELPGDEVDFACPLGADWYELPSGARARLRALGPGGWLMRILWRFGFAVDADCRCKSRAAMMDRWGWWGCLWRSPLIASWLLTALLGLKKSR